MIVADLQLELRIDAQGALEMVNVLRLLHHRPKAHIQWDALFSNEAYQALFRKAEFVSAVPPCSRRDFKDYVSEVPNWIGREHSVLSREYLWSWAWEHSDEVASWCHQFTSDRGCFEEIVQRASEYIPRHSKLGRVNLYLLIRGCFGGEVDRLRKNIFLDVPDPILFGRQRLISILSHELIHIYQYDLVNESYNLETMEPEKRVLFEYILRPIAMEGGAGLIDDVEKLMEEATTEAQKAFVDAVFPLWKPPDLHKHDDHLALIQSEICSLLQGRRSAEEGQTAIENVIGTGNVTHGIGAQMARLIDTELGRDVLRHSHDPFTFFFQYQEAAKKTEGSFMFEERTLQLLKERFSP